MAEEGEVLTCPDCGKPLMKIQSLPQPFHANPIDAKNCPGPTP